MYFVLIHWSQRHKAHLQEAVRWAEGFGGSGKVVHRGSFFEDHKLSLDLAGTNVTDGDLNKLGPQTDLSLLNLANAAITDDGLRLLHKGELEFLNVSGTRVTPAGVSELGDALRSAGSLHHGRTRFIATH